MKGGNKSYTMFAKRNNVDPQDIRTRDKGDGVELEIRRSSLDGRGLRDSGEGRRDDCGEEIGGGECIAEPGDPVVVHEDDGEHDHEGRGAVPRTILRLLDYTRASCKRGIRR